MLTTRCKDPFCASRTDILKRVEQIRRHVKSAMKSDGKGTCQLDELPSPFDIYVSVRVKNSEYYTVSAFTPGKFDITAHRVEILRSSEGI